MMRIVKTNKEMNFLKLTRYNRGISTPKGIKATIFPKSYNHEKVSFGKCNGTASGTNINVYPYELTACSILLNAKNKKYRVKTVYKMVPAKMIFRIFASIITPLI
jgi:hypothetical protein